MKDFFISYNSKDKEWAEWIAWTLEEAGYTTLIQEWDFRPGGNFVLEMHKSTKGTKATVAVLSQNYLSAEYTQPEWADAFARDPEGNKRTLLPVRIDNCCPDGLLAQIIYVDLNEVLREEAHKVLLEAIGERGKPASAPPFPGSGKTVGNQSSMQSQNQEPPIPAKTSTILESKKLLAQHQQNLIKLKQQEAVHGLGEVPLKLLNQITHEKKRIAELEQELEQDIRSQEEVGMNGKTLRQKFEDVIMDEDDLRRFCQDNFRHVYRRLKPTDRWDHIVGQIIRYCETRNEVEKLNHLLK